MPKRKNIGKKLRFEIFKRDEFTCQYCGSHPPKAILEVDHIVPVIKNGTNDIDNLVTSCFDCNRGKSANSLEIIPESLKDKASRIKESEDQLIAYNKIMQEKQDRLEDQTWEVVEIFDKGCDSIDRRLFSSMKRYVDILGLHETKEAMEIAYCKIPHSKTNRMKYFHGICRNKIKES